jgi:MraZ protein
VTRGFEKCVYIYPQDEWVKMENAIRSLTPTDPEHRFFMRVLLQHATDFQLDAQARITIPKELLQHAEIDGAVLIIGQLEHIEVWNPKEYKKYLDAQHKTYEDVAQTVLQKKG